VIERHNPVDRQVIAEVDEFNRMVSPRDFIDDRGLFWSADAIAGDDYIPSLRGGLQIQWTYSKVCNFSCVHCFNGSGPEWRGFEADPFRIAECIAGAKPYNVCLCGGEPFTWRPLYAIVEKLRASGIPLVSTVTNGYLATADRLQRLFDAGLTHLQISLDGLTDDEFIELRVKKDGLTRASAAVQAALKHPWMDFSVSFTPTRRNVASWKRFCHYWAGQGVTHIRTQPFMPIGTGTNSKALAPSDEQYLRFHMDTLDLANELDGCFVDWGDPLEHIWFYTRTPAHPWSFGIQTDGWFELSCYVPVLLGSALEHSVEEFWAMEPKELWNAPVVRRFADSLTSMHGMSQLDVEIYKEDSLHIDVFDPAQRDLFLRSDDIESLREVSRANVRRHCERSVA
jgi:MoaA/NifB/PqqE/SkfB family radical SAM enzyme